MSAKWMKFCIFYFLTAIIGTAIVFFVAQAVRDDHIQNLYSTPRNKPVAITPPAKQVQKSPVPAKKPTKPIATNTVAPQEKPKKTDTNYYALASADVRLKKWDSALKYCNMGLSKAPGNYQLIKLKEIIDAKGIRWGTVNAAQSAVFNAQGKVIQTILNGTLVEVSGTKRSSVGRLALCRIKTNENTLNKVFVMEKDLTLRYGTLDSVNDGLKKLFAQKTEIAAKIEERKKLLSKAIAKKNPYLSEYSAAINASNEFWKKVKILQTTRDTSSGQEAMDASDKLRMMKGQDIQLANNLSEAKEKYLAWKATHSNSFDQDPTIKHLSKQLLDINNKIANFKM